MSIWRLPLSTQSFISADAPAFLSRAFRMGHPRRQNPRRRSRTIRGARLAAHSALVCEPFRRHCLGRALTDAILCTALEHRVDAVACCSTDAQEYWTRIGYVEVPITSWCAYVQRSTSLTVY